MSKSRVQGFLDSSSDSGGNRISKYSIERGQEPEEIVCEEVEVGLVEKSRPGAATRDEKLQLSHRCIVQTIFHVLLLEIAGKYFSLKVLVMAMNSE